MTVPTSAAQFPQGSDTTPVTGFNARQTRPPPPRTPYRSWIRVRSPQLQHADRFVRVVSFNVMSEDSTRKRVLKDKQTSNPSALRSSYGLWEHRGPLLFGEIISQEPDIVCLQEVDQFEYFQQRLLPRGFAGIFERRLPTESLRYYVSKGLAIFWRTDKFELVGRGVYSLRSPPTDTRQDQIALLARLKRRDPYDAKRTLGEIDVWNAHLLIGLENRHQSLRLDQVRTLFDIIGNESNSTLMERFHGSKEDVDAEKLNKEKQKNADESQASTTSQTGASIEELQRLFKRRMEQAIGQTDKNAGNDKPNEEENEKEKEQEKDKEKEKEKEQTGKDKEKEKEKEKGNENDNDVSTSKPSDKETKKDDEYKSRLRGGPTSLQRPVILCVDFSDHALFEPDRKSVPLVYTYLTNRSRTTDNHREYSRILPRELREQHERHSWFLQSAYALGFGREPYFTCCVNQHLTLTSDLILFTPQNFRVINLLEPLAREWVEQQETKTLPCRNYPSDHYLVGCDLELAIGHTPTAANNPTEGTGMTTSANINATPNVPNRFQNPNYGTNPVVTPNPNMNLHMGAMQHFNATQPMMAQDVNAMNEFYQNGHMRSRGPNVNFPQQQIHPMAPSSQTFTQR